MAMPKFAPKSTREAHEQEIADLEMVVNPNTAQAMDSSRFVDSQRVNPRRARKRLEDEKQRLRAVTPKHLTQLQRDEAIERIKLLETAMVKGSPENDIPAMPSKQQQWQASDADVSQNISWLDFWKAHNLKKNGGPVKIDKSTQQGAVWEWMDLRRQVLRDDDESGSPGVASIESIRPDKTLDSSRRSLHAPWSGVSFERYNAIMGGRPALSKVQFQVLEAEASGLARPRTAEEMAPSFVVGTPAICKAPAKDGTPCGMRVSRDGDRCFHHEGIILEGEAEEDEETLLRHLPETDQF